MRLIPFSRYKIFGHSMQPLYKEGETVWVYNWAYIFNQPRVGDIIVFKFSGNLLIKQVTRLTSKGLLVSGINTEDSFDSRKFGEVKFDQIVGKVLVRKKES